MKIVILGTRGIPNNHGGFEQFAEYLAIGLVKHGYQVSVYNSHKHPYKEKDLEGVSIIHCYDPEDVLGTAGQFIYDFNCIIDSWKRNFDIILQLGYTSSSVFGRLLPRRKSIVTTNMDGLEWKRSKYSKLVQKFLEYAERLAIKFSDHLISDSVGIQIYLNDKYQKTSVFIPYGAHVFNSPDDSILNEYGLSTGNYNILIARLEPENNIESILDGVVAADSNMPFLVIGKHETKFGSYLKKKFASATHIQFLGGIYDLHKLNNLRYFANLYFHGHTVGGTNPSLLEAMASHALICAHDNIFNRSILGDDAYYFKSSKDISKILNGFSTGGNNILKSQEYKKSNIHKIEATYSWPIIIDQYIDHFNTILNQRAGIKKGQMV
jgi:glycosyltransferase involved in cell wall biosynthesis